MALGWICSRFGTKSGGQLGPSWHRNLKKMDAKKATSRRAASRWGPPRYRTLNRLVSFHDGHEARWRIFSYFIYGPQQAVSRHSRRLLRPADHGPPSSRRRDTKPPRHRRSVDGTVRLSPRQTQPEDAGRHETRTHRKGHFGLLSHWLSGQNL